ncbi:MAG: hypothetical protein NZ572_04720 [Thermoflexus sp.]|nr:hypothetical protein [Thermoflexus sp.]
MFLAEHSTAMRAHLPLMQALYQEIQIDEANCRRFIEQIAWPFLEQMRERPAAVLQQRRCLLYPVLVL